MEVASTKYPWHKTHTRCGLMSVSLTRPPPLQGTTASPYCASFCSADCAAGVCCCEGVDDDDVMMMAVRTTIEGLGLSIRYRTVRRF